MSKKCLATSFCNTLCNNAYEIGKQRWETLKKHLKNWRGLDKFGELYDAIDWDAGPNGNYLHKNCGLKIASSRFLEQAQTRCDKSRKSGNLEAEADEEVQNEDDLNTPPPAKITHSSHPGPLYDKYHCV